MSSNPESEVWRRRGRPFLAVVICAFLVLALWSEAATPPPANLQFDVFLGYDGIVPEASWFPVVCEVKNDGPSFVGTVEVMPGNYNQGQTRRAVVELPTGTLKRFVIPVFSTTRGFASWDVRLVDERGKVRGEQSGLRPRKQIGANTPLLGALPRTASGTPMVRAVLPQLAELQPAAARFQAPVFPDNPLVLEGMDTLYLNSEKAAELRVPNQVDALYDWLHAGGHLIVAVEQISDVTSTPWLRSLIPCDLKEIQSVQRHAEIQEWVRSAYGSTNLANTGSSRPAGSGADRRRSGLPPGGNRSVPQPEAAANNPFSDLPEDLAFEAAALQVATGEVRDGRVVVAAGDTPLIVTANRGRGRVTALLFSPEREPFRSWKNLPTFWARLTEVPSAWYVASDFNRQGGWSSDGIFGAMIDTRQVHKLPVGWLLLLLLVYLVVIGPVDQFWLKRIGRPMLTWITFPCYVVLFSLLIYFIGYKLRAGESEWNELHLVDVLPHGERAELRGRTYASVYSPANQRYLLESQERFATLRGEFVGSWGAGQSSEKATVMQNGDSFKAEIFVPVWTSQLFVSDWWQSADVPLKVTMAPQSGDQWQVKVENRTDSKLTKAQIVLEDFVLRLGELAAKETKTFNVSKGQGTPLKEFVGSYGRTFQTAVPSRQSAFGGSESGRISDLPDSTLAASFISQLGGQPNNWSFVAPPGLDLSSVIEHGNAVLFAWASDYSPIKPMYRFSPRRSHRDTMWRIAVPVGS